MKKLILSAFVVLSIDTINAQHWSGVPTLPTTIITRTANVGIGPAVPTTFPLNITPHPTLTTANAQGWKRGMVLLNSSALYWDGGPNTANDYFMAHSSSSPVGDFYQGYSAGTGPTAPVTYVSKVYVTTPPVYIPSGSTQVFKNLLVEEAGSLRSVGVNVLDPARTTEILHPSQSQLRLTQAAGILGGPAFQGVYTDFQTTNLGDLVIRPRNVFAQRRVGIDVPTPTEKLDVNGNARLRIVPLQTPNCLMTGVTQGGNPNDIVFSRLAFTGSSTQVLLGDGTWGTVPSSAASANNGLSVAGPNVVLGQKCFEGGNPAALIGNREIPMAGNNLYFTGQGNPSTNAVAVGYTACVTLPAVFNTLKKNSTPVTVSTIGGSFINQDLLTTSGAITGVMGISDQAQPSGNISNVGGSFRGANSPVNIGINADAGGNSGSLQSIAGQFTSMLTNPGSNVGVTTRVMGGTSNIGVVGSGTGGSTSYGVQATSGGATTNNYGVNTTANGLGSSTNYGVNASASGGINSYAVYGLNGGVAPNHWAGYFQGDVNINGEAYCTLGIWSGSDKRFKKDIKGLENVSEKIKKLNGYSYNFKTEEFPEKRFNSKTRIGLIAQELKEVFPELVTEDATGFYAVDYQGMIPVLLEAIKAQQKETEELKAMVKNLSNSGASDNTGISERKISSVMLSDAQSIILEQNVPNPFAEQTSIAYTLIEGVQKAQILFYNLEGKLINSSDLKPVVGMGQLNVFASDLSNGVYTYSLVVDGKIIETKRMVKSK
jgi:nitrogen regulatory protein PII-like uncharacterized protein